MAGMQLTFSSTSWYSSESLSDSMAMRLRVERCWCHSVWSRLYKQQASRYQFKISMAISSNQTKHRVPRPCLGKIMTVWASFATQFATFHTWFNQILLDNASWPSFYAPVSRHDLPIFSSLSNCESGTLAPRTNRICHCSSRQIPLDVSCMCTCYHRYP